MWCTSLAQLNTPFFPTCYSHKLFRTSFALKLVNNIALHTHCSVHYIYEKQANLFLLHLAYTLILKLIILFFKDFSPEKKIYKVKV